MQAVRLPDAAHRAGADPARCGHHVSGPVRRLARSIGQGQRDQALSRAKAMHVGKICFYVSVYALS